MMGAGDRRFAASENMAVLRDAIGAVRNDLCTYQAAAEIYHQEIITLLGDIREELRKQNRGTSPAPTGNFAGLFRSRPSEFPGGAKLRIIPVSFSKKGEHGPEAEVPEGCADIPAGTSGDRRRREGIILGFPSGNTKYRPRLPEK